MRVRRFSNGGFEALTYAVRPMEQEFAKQRFVNHFDGKIPRSKPEEEKIELTPEQIEAQKIRNFCRSIKRSKQMIRWTVKEMKADRLLTLTFRENLQDRERCKKIFARFVRLVRDDLGEERRFSYVSVLEKQDRGALHVHMAVRGFLPISVLRKCWYRANGGTGNEVKGATPGQVDITSPKGRWGSGWRKWDTSKLAGYLVKYLHKTFEECESEKKRYWRSEDIDLASPSHIWLGSAETPDQAITETIAYLQQAYGLKGASFDMWLSPDWTKFWISGQGETDPLWDCPF